MRAQLLHQIQQCLEERVRIDDRYDDRLLRCDMEKANKMRDSELEYYLGRIDDKVRRLRRQRVAL